MPVKKRCKSTRIDKVLSAFITILSREWSVNESEILRILIQNGAVWLISTKANMEQINRDYSMFKNQIKEYIVSKGGIKQ